MDGVLLRERLSYPDFLDFRSEPVAIVSREFAERARPDDGALGRRRDQSTVIACARVGYWGGLRKGNGQHR
jgi:hypothetical protein